MHATQVPCLCLLLLLSCCWNNADAVLLRHIGLRLANSCLIRTKRVFTTPATPLPQRGTIGCRYGKLVQALKQPSRRFAHVQYARPESAAAALAALNQKLVGSSWEGRAAGGAVPVCCGKPLQPMHWLGLAASPARVWTLHQLPPA